MPKIYLSPAAHAHDNSTKCPMSCGENIHNNQYMDIVESRLKELGFEVKRGDKSKTGSIAMSTRVTEANQWKADLYYVSHTNAGGGRYSMTMYYPNANSKAKAEIFHANRKCITHKIKQNKDLYEIASTSMVCMYDELFFHDNAEDCAWFHNGGMGILAEETCKAICQIFNKAYQPHKETTPTTPTTEVKTYAVVTNINRYATASDAKEQKNAKPDKLAPGTYYIYNKYPNGANGMYNISKDNTGNSAGSWINPTENVVKQEETTPKYYRVRMSKDDAKTQKGAYTDKQNAIDCCQAAGAGYHVFDWDWNIVYSYVAPVVATTLSSIAVTTLPLKTIYTVGDTYDGAGMIVTATYSDNSTKVITDYTTSGFNSTKAGSNTIYVLFENKVATFIVTIKEAPQEPLKVYELDYPEKTRIIDSSIKRTNKDCVKCIKKILSNNSIFNSEICKAFFTIAPIYEIDPMMAIAQSILETGWFRYAGSAVQPSHHNYCGLGVTVNGKPGNIFDSIEDGVRAQLQHLFAYSCKGTIPSGEKLIDERFKYVTRGIAPLWQQLAGRWACPGYDTNKFDTPEDAMNAGNTYGQKILAIYKDLIATEVTDEEVAKYFEVKEDTPVDPEPVNPDKNDIDDELHDNMNFVFKWIRKIIEAIIKAIVNDGE